jgi:hypothetical protein
MKAGPRPSCCVYACDWRAVGCKQKSTDCERGGGCVRVCVRVCSVVVRVCSVVVRVYVRVHLCLRVEV